MTSEEDNNPQTFYEDTATRPRAFWDAMHVTAVQGVVSAALWTVGFHVNGGLLQHAFPKGHVGTFSRSLVISVTSVTVVIAQAFCLGVVTDRWRDYRQTKNGISRLDLDMLGSEPQLRIRTPGNWCGGVSVPLHDITMKALRDDECQICTPDHGNFLITNLSKNISDFETYKKFLEEVTIEAPPPIAKSKEIWTPLLTLDKFDEEASIVDFSRDSEDYVAIHNGHDQYYVLRASRILGSFSRRDERDYLSTRWEVDLRYNSFPTMTHDGVLYCDFGRKIEQAVSTNKYLNPCPTDAIDVYLEHTLVKE